ncbi:MAG: sigma-70 family RNA polymerase sigma factor [Candidatus Latescibacterota bacterium]|nr:MAG: sigma-70 family RNA polymerase sigma factor [Candidatus Latescibacterota bacterium]
MSNPHRRKSVGNTRDAADDAGGAWSDRSMLEGVRRRDPEALTRFFDVFFPYVYNLAYRLLGNRDTAEDVVQDVFLKVYRAADRLDIERHPKPWLTTITYNTCRDAARRTAARPDIATDSTTIGEQHGAPDTPEDVLLRQERENMVERALLELDEHSRALVILHDYCGVPHEEIATVMNMSHAAVRKRYSRALKRLAQIIRGLQQ